MRVGVGAVGGMCFHNQVIGNHTLSQKCSVWLLLLHQRINSEDLSLLCGQVTLKFLHQGINTHSSCAKHTCVMTRIVGSGIQVWKVVEGRVRSNGSGVSGATMHCM